MVAIMRNSAAVPPGRRGFKVVVQQRLVSTVIFVKHCARFTKTLPHHYYKFMTFQTCQR
jgi:hypothetical protein